jgi:hypothetical protein
VPEDLVISLKEARHETARQAGSPTRITGSHIHHDTETTTISTRYIFFQIATEVVGTNG